MMSEKIEINTLITKHENKCKGCRFEMIDVEDPLWEYGSPLKRVLIDNQTGETYDSVSELVGLLNNLDKENKECRKPLSDDDIRRLYCRLQEKEYRRHCSGGHCYTLDTSDNRVRL